MNRTLLKLASLVLTLAPSAFADTVVLRSGRELEGTSRWRDDGKLEVTTRLGGVVVDRADVARIHASETPGAELARRRAALAPDDLAGRLELARFALARQLERDAAALLVEVVTAPARPGDAAVVGEAAKLLGERLDHHLVDGRWVAPAEYYLAHGFVRRGSRWVARAQAELADEGARLEEASERTRVEARRAGRRVEPAQLAASEAEAKLHRIERALVDLAERLIGARSVVRAREEEASVADAEVVTGQAELARFLAGPFNRGTPRAEDQELTVRLQVARLEQVRARARDALALARAGLAELEQVQARGPAVKAEAEAALARARQDLAAAEDAQLEARADAELTAASREANRQRLREARGRAE